MAELLTENGSMQKASTLMRICSQPVVNAAYVQGRKMLSLFLRQLPNESQTIVSGFHVAEHLSFSTIRILVSGGIANC